MTTPAIGSPAPSFTLPDADGNQVSLEAYRGRSVVLYFYPKSFTGGCTAQACSLRDAHGSLLADGIEIIGISVDDVDTQRRFRDEYALPFAVLSDVGGKVASAYGVYGITKADGSILDEARRVTFIIDDRGVVRQVIDPAHADVHADEVREALAATA